LTKTEIVRTRLTRVILPNSREERIRKKKRLKKERIEVEVEEKTEKSDE
jgi:hypothetical protein